MGSKGSTTSTQQQRRHRRLTCCDCGCKRPRQLCEMNYHRHHTASLRRNTLRWPREGCARPGEINCSRPSAELPRADLCLCVTSNEQGVHGLDLEIRVLISNELEGSTNQRPLAKTETSCWSKQDIAIAMRRFSCSEENVMKGTVVSNPTGASVANCCCSHSVATESSRSEVLEMFNNSDYSPVPVPR